LSFATAAIHRTIINFAALEHAQHQRTLTHPLLLTGHYLRPIGSRLPIPRRFPAGFLTPHFTARTQRPTANTAKSIAYHHHGLQLRLQHAQLERRSWWLALWNCGRQQHSTAEQATFRRRSHTYLWRRTLWRC
jgi:hypothetical protein